MNDSSFGKTDETALIRASQTGDQRAFGRLVTRHQSLICALAYSATGNLARSEELAQETFVTAWKNLSSLREPPKLRSWLRGIARNLISNAQRRASHDAAHLAEPFPPGEEPPAPEPSPRDETVRREEEALLWHALEQIPQTYREPLVLYYREHRSVENVARELELTEDAVKQRLARGRAQLQEATLALIEGTLERSRPGVRFTAGVVGVLPPLAIAGTASTAVAVGHGAAGTKGSGWIGSVFALVSAQVAWFVSTLTLVSFVGALIGWQMSSPTISEIERRWADRFWHWTAIGLIACVLLPLGVVLPWIWSPPPDSMIMLRSWVALLYLLSGVPLARWAWANHRRIRSRTCLASAKASPRLRWVIVCTLGFGSLQLQNFAAGHWATKLRPAQLWTVISSHPGATLVVDETAGGHRWIEVEARAGDRTLRVRGPLDDTLARRLREHGLSFRVRVEGRDYNQLGRVGEPFGIVMPVVVAAGITVLARRVSRRLHRPTINLLKGCAVRREA